MQFEWAPSTVQKLSENKFLTVAKELFMIFFVVCCDKRKLVTNLFLLSRLDFCFAVLSMICTCYWYIFLLDLIL